MRTGMLVLAAASVVFFSAQAFAEDQAAPAAPTAAATAPATTDDPTVCKSEASPTGTRFGSRKVCMRQSEWNQRQTEGRDTVNQAQSSQLRAKPPGN